MTGGKSAPTTENMPDPLIRRIHLIIVGVMELVMAGELAVLAMEQR